MIFALFFLGTLACQISFYDPRTVPVDSAFFYEDGTGQILKLNLELGKSYIMTFYPIEQSDDGWFSYSRLSDRDHRSVKFPKMNSRYTSTFTSTSEPETIYMIGNKKTAFVVCEDSPVYHKSIVPW